MSRQHKQRSQRGAVSKILETSGDKFTKTPNADLVRSLGKLGLTVEQIVPLMEVAERELFRRRLARASENAAAGSLDELEKTIRNMHDNLSAYFGDRKKACRIFLDAWPPRARRVFAALLVGRKRGRQPGDAGRVARKNERLLRLYKMKQAEDLPMGPWIFARWFHEEMGEGASVRANYEKLRLLLK